MSRFVYSSRRTKSVSASEVRSFASKAAEFAEAASSELQASRFVAAASLAIHAGINAADAVCGARLGVRMAGESHDNVLGLLGEAGSDGTEVAKHLRRLLPMKTKTEYQPDAVSAAAAAKAVERASMCVAVALRVVRGLD